MQKEVINGKVVSRWFSRGKARIPIFEDGTIGVDTYRKQGMEDKDKLKGETREQRQKWNNAFYQGHSREYYKNIVDKYDKQMEEAGKELNVNDYNFAKSQKEAWNKNYEKAVNQENEFNNLYNNSEEAKYVSKMVDYNAKTRTGRYANYAVEDVVAKDKEPTLYEQVHNTYTNPRAEVSYYLKKGEFSKADQYMKDYGLEDERSEFIDGLKPSVARDYNKYLNEKVSGTKKYEVYNKTKVDEGHPKAQYRLGEYKTEEEAYRAIESQKTIDKSLGIDDDYDISPMSEYSDTTGTGYTDKQVKAYKDYLLKTQGTTDEDIINAGREPENRVSIEKFANEQANTKAKIEKFNQRKGKTQETYTKSGNIRYSAFGIERTPEDDFSDDGTRFTAYRLPNGMEMTVAKGGDDIYLSLRNPYNKEVSYEEYSSLPHYKDLDMYNGVAKNSVDLNKVVEASNNYMNEYNELLKKKGIKPEIRTNKELRLDSIKRQIENNEASIKYYNENQDYSRWRYNMQQKNRLMKKNDRLRKELEKLQ